MSGLGPAPWTPGHHARGSAGQGSREPGVRGPETAPDRGPESRVAVTQVRVPGAEGQECGTL